MSSDGKKSLGFKQIHFLPLSLLPLEINKALLIPRSFKFYLYFLPSLVFEGCGISPKSARRGTWPFAFRKKAAEIR